MYKLTAQQKNTLLEVINEQFGTSLPFDDFVESALSLFEDIPGFEAIPDDKSAPIIQNLWSKYHG